MPWQVSPIVIRLSLILSMFTYNALAAIAPKFSGSESRKRRVVAIFLKPSNLYKATASKPFLGRLIANVRLGLSAVAPSQPASVKRRVICLARLVHDTLTPFFPCLRSKGNGLPYISPLSTNVTKSVV